MAAPPRLLEGLLAYGRQLLEQDLAPFPPAAAHHQQQQQANPFSSPSHNHPGEGSMLNVTMYQEEEDSQVLPSYSSLNLTLLPRVPTPVAPVVVPQPTYREALAKAREVLPTIFPQK